MFPRLPIIAGLFVAVALTMAWAQDAPQDDSPVAQPPVITLPVDQNDPGVIRARHELEQINRLVQSGALPVARLRKAQENVQDAGDMSLLKELIQYRLAA